MSLTNPFSFHYQGVWLERAANPVLPDWLRLAALAFGKHKANGHANFGTGEIANLLGRRSPDGQLKPLSGSAVSNAIRRAKELGFIADQSHARCLVVPPHAVTNGLGKAYESCRIHAGAKLGAACSVSETSTVHANDELAS